MVKNQGAFRMLSSIDFATVNKSETRETKKHDFVSIFFIFKFLKFSEI